MLCKIDYQVAKANVTQYANDDALVIDGIGDVRRLQNFTGIMLAELIMDSLSGASQELPIGDEMSINSSDPDWQDGLFYLLLRTSRAAGSIGKLLNATTLRDSAVQVFGHAQLLPASK